MHEEVIEKLLSSIQKNSFSCNYPALSGEGYKPCRIDSRNFREIISEQSGRKIAYVDGGNAEIIGASNFSLSLVRVASVVYSNNKKFGLDKSEFFVMANAVHKNGEIHYEVSVFGNKSRSMGGSESEFHVENQCFSSYDPTLMLGMNRASIGSIANVIRRFAELKLAQRISSEGMSDIIILDGNLQSTITNESAVLDELYSSCLRSGTILGGLCKSSSLFADNGSLLGPVLDSMSNMPGWLYHPIAEIESRNHKADMFLVKMHPKSNHIFRLDIFNRQADKAYETASSLSSNCVDPVFIGYPYGLVEADRNARVQNSEKESLRTMIMYRLKNKDMEKYLTSQNAHGILDRISF